MKHFIEFSLYLFYFNKKKSYVTKNKIIHRKTNSFPESALGIENALDHKTIINVFSALLY